MPDALCARRVRPGVGLLIELSLIDGWQSTPSACRLLPQSSWPERIHGKYATFGAGCFWGAEHLLRSVPGVTTSRVGYMGGTTTAPTYEVVRQGDTGHIEVVEITYNPEHISYQDLLDVFWQLHDPRSLDDQGPYEYGSQYRAVIFYHDAEQATLAVASKTAREVSGLYAGPIVTAIHPATTFWPAEDYHQQYIAKGGAHHCHVFTRTIRLPERSRDRSGTAEVG